MVSDNARRVPLKVVEEEMKSEALCSYSHRSAADDLACTTSSNVVTTRTCAANARTRRKGTTAITATRWFCESVIKVISSKLCHATVGCHLERLRYRVLPTFRSPRAQPDPQSNNHMENRHASVWQPDGVGAPAKHESGHFRWSRQWHGRHPALFLPDRA